MIAIYNSGGGRGTSGTYYETCPSSASEAMLEQMDREREMLRRMAQGYPVSEVEFRDRIQRVYYEESPCQSESPPKKDLRKEKDEKLKSLIAYYYNRR